VDGVAGKQVRVTSDLGNLLLSTLGARNVLMLGYFC
jgi:hypothetical protein